MKKNKTKIAFMPFLDENKERGMFYDFISDLPKLLNIWNFLCLEFWQEDSDNVEEKEEIYLQY